jgi:hypothetical protein
VPQALQQGVEPQRIAGAFDADGHGWRQRGIEAFDGVAIVGQFDVVVLTSTEATSDVWLFS